MASVFHRCHNCGCETDMSNALSAFEDHPHCRQCGLSITESDSKMQDDLINLMSRNLQLNPIQHDGSMPPTPQVCPQPSPIAYITQHYHHSAHQVAPASDQSVSAVLESAGVNASVLLPSQLQLFRNAETDQQRRLVELWTIAPPTSGNQLLAKDLENWPQTSMEKEEAAARQRWESAEQEKLKNLASLPSREPRSSPEPYIVQGYQNIPNTNGLTAPSEFGSQLPQTTELKPSNDPAYSSSREWWHMADEEPMEHQYGMLQQVMYGYPVEYPIQAKEDADMS